MFTLIIASLLAVELLEIDMTFQERKKTGVVKLNSKEKAELQNWIDAHYEKRAEPIALFAKSKHGQIEENLDNGQKIRLNDGTVWQIHPSDAPISQSWITPVDIIVSQNKDSDYPYRLTNSLTGSSVRAQRVPNTILKQPEESASIYAG